MKLQKKLITLLMVLVALLAGSGTYSALAQGTGTDTGQLGIFSTVPCGPDALGWLCSTTVVRSGTTTTCTATATSPGGSYNIFMYGSVPNGKALHIGSTYYGSNNTKSAFASSLTIKFTYTGSAQPTLCNWHFEF